MPSLINTLKIGTSVTNRILHPRISHANIALTMQCNHKCYCCNIWKNNGHSTDYISSNDITKIITNNDLMWISLTGGEPFLNRDIYDILFQCLSLCKMVYVVTNGSLPDRISNAIINCLNESGNGGAVLFVNFSLLGDKDTHDSLTNAPGSYDRVIECIKRLKHYNPSRLILSIHYTLSEQSKDGWPNVQQLADELKVGLVCTPEQHADYYQVNHNGSQPVEAPYIPINQTFMYYYTKYLWSKNVNCVAGQYSCFIMPDKTVYPCFFSVPNNADYNLKDTNYKLSPLTRTKEWVKECKGCNTLCEIKSTLIFRPWRLL